MIRTRREVEPRLVSLETFFSFLRESILCSFSWTIEWCIICWSLLLFWTSYCQFTTVYYCLLLTRVLLNENDFVSPRFTYQWIAETLTVRMVYFEFNIDVVEESRKPKNLSVLWLLTGEKRPKSCFIHYCALLVNWIDLGVTPFERAH